MARLNKQFYGVYNQGYPNQNVFETVKIRFLFAVVFFLVRTESPHAGRNQCLPDR